MTTIARADGATAARPRTPGSPDGFVLGGRGVWVWEAGRQDPGRLAARLRRHGFHWLAVKALDGTSRFNTDAQLRAYAAAARREGLAFGLWAYLVGNDPAAEARLCADLVEQHDAAFLLADAESEYERAQGPVSRRFARAFRARLPHLPAALSSFGRIDLHPGLDWRAWCDAGFDFHPQAYACESAALSPRACVERATAVWPRDRIRPTLGAYRGAAGRPSAAALADSVRGLGATGFDVWRVGSLRDADLAALGAVPAGGRRASVRRAPHRPLIPMTPMLKGGDVRALQEAINARRRARRLGVIAVDGEYGPETHGAAFQIAWILGLGSRRASAGAFSVYKQVRVRDPEQRSATQLARALERKRQIATERHGPEAVLAFARRHAGERLERPAGTNRGPLLDAWGKPFGSPQRPGVPGWQWCGIFVATALREAGIVVGKEFMWTPTGMGWARAGTSGFRRGLVSVAEARPGDVVWFDFNRADTIPCNHVGLVEHNLGGGALQTIEGNTHPEGGGGDWGVYRRRRHVADGIVAVGRPRYLA